jgi:hypothetical protein
LFFSERYLLGHDLIGKIGGRLPRMPNKNKQTTRKKSSKKTKSKRKVVRKRAASKRPKKSGKKTTPKRSGRRKTISMRSLARKAKFSAKRRRLTSTGLVVETVPLPPGQGREHLDGQVGDLEGLSNRPTANSESVE